MDLWTATAGKTADGRLVDGAKRRAAHEPAHSPRLPPTGSTGDNNRVEINPKSKGKEAVSLNRHAKETACRSRPRPPPFSAGGAWQEKKPPGPPCGGCYLILGCFVSHSQHDSGTISPD